MQEHDEREERQARPAEDGVAPAVAGPSSTPGPASGVATSSDERDERPGPRRSATGSAQAAARLCRARPDAPGHRDAGPAPRSAGPAHRWSYRTSSPRSGARGAVRAVPDQEPDGGDEQPQRGGRAGHVLQRRDAEQQRRGRPSPGRHDRSSAARRSSRLRSRAPGRRGRRAPRPTGWCRSSCCRTTPWSPGRCRPRPAARAIMHLGVEAGAEDGHDRGAEQAGEGHGRGDLSPAPRAAGGTGPAAKTTMSTAPSVVMLWKANSTAGLLVAAPAATPSVVPPNSSR